MMQTMAIMMAASSAQKQFKGYNPAGLGASGYGYNSNMARKPSKPFPKGSPQTVNESTTPQQQLPMPDSTIQSSLPAAAAAVLENPF